MKRLAALLLLALPASVLCAGELEPTPPGAASARLLAERLHDDLGAGLAGGMPTILLEAVCELDPERFGLGPAELYERFGYLRVKGDPLPVGVTERRVLGVRLRNYNCLACHASSEEGRVVVGAPNVGLDFTGFYEEVFATIVATVKDEKCRPRSWVKLLDAARRARRRQHERLSAVEAAALLAYAEVVAQGDGPKKPEHAYGPGRTVVTAAYRKLRFDMDPGPFAPVKAPDLFGVRARSGLLWTGNERYTSDVSPAEKIARNGLLVPWVQVHPLLKKPVPDSEIVRRLDQHRRMAALLVESAPPPSPLPASRERHARGKTVYANECARCHGDYSQSERDGRLLTRIASYEEKLVDIEEVGTDAAYEASQDGEFNRRIGETAIGKLYSESKADGTYVARPLLGLRLRAPYLHNASVPTLADLLLEPEKRPKKFTVGTGTRARERDTTVPGNRASGHRYGTELSEKDKEALVEYLKTL